MCEIRPLIGGCMMLAVLLNRLNAISTQEGMYEEMRFVFLALFVALAVSLQAQEKAPLKLVETIPLWRPDSPCY